MNLENDPQAFWGGVVLLAVFVTLVVAGLVSIGKKKSDENREYREHAEASCIYCGSFDSGENCPHCEPRRQHIRSELRAAGEFATT